MDWIKEDPLTDRPENGRHWSDPPRVWQYTLPGGHRVMAGKTDADNDRLSLKVAGPNDWWFHVRGMPGSHVVLMAAGDRTPDRNTLNQAGAKPGTVQIRKERVFKVRPALPETY